MKQIYLILMTFLLFASFLNAQDHFLSPVEGIMTETSLRADNPPVWVKDISNFSGVESGGQVELDLTGYFEDPDDDVEPALSVTVNSVPAVADIAMEGNLLKINFKEPGQTNVEVTASSNGLTTSTSFVVGVIPEITGDYEIATFEEQNLEVESYWNGADGSGGFVSGPAWFFNNYNADWGSWSGWALSNISDNTTPGWVNQYSAITGRGLSGDDPAYAINYISPSSGLIFKDSAAHIVEGCFITNATYTALSVKFGDDFSKKFGGVDGNDEDWLQLNIEGYVDGASSNTVTFHLADFTFEDNTKDYIVETWQWVDLSSLGKVDSLSFSMASTDVGDWGMNTPSYFSMDNLVVVPDAPPFIQNPLSDVSDETGKKLEVNISDLFSDPDDEDSDIVKVLKSNSDTAIVNAEIQQDKLVLDIKKKGASTLVLEGISNNKSVLDTMVVSGYITNLQLDQYDRINLYPNPTEGFFRVNTGLQSNAVLTVFDLSGRVLITDNAYSSGEVVDLSGASAGTYVVKLQAEGRVFRKAIILK